jgi:hypothetical protein
MLGIYCRIEASHLIFIGHIFGTLGMITQKERLSLQSTHH